MTTADCINCDEGNDNNYLDHLYFDDLDHGRAHRGTQRFRGRSPWRRRREA